MSRAQPRRPARAAGAQVSAATVAAVVPHERPILFSASMIRALLAGRKSQTRRLYEPRYPEPYEVMDETPAGKAWPFVTDEAGTYHFRESPYGKVGDRLWVKETWMELDNEIYYRATDPGWDDNDTGVKWKPSIFMRRASSRITLEVTDVRVERVSAISADDARSEGFSSDPIPCSVNGKPATACFFDPLQWFAALWDGINSERAPWKSSPWVWVVGFKVVQPSNRCSCRWCPTS